MIYDRPYMRTPREPEKSPHRVTNTLLIGTLVVFVLQHLLHVFFPGARGTGLTQNFFNEWFALSGLHFQELKVWTLLSYGFLHSLNNILHIIGNMAGLFFLGRILEPQLGQKPFLILYLGGALSGGLLYLIFHYNSPVVVIGASASVSALVALFCLRHPEHTITLLLFFVIPVSIKPKYLLRIAFAFSIFGLLFLELGKAGPGIAHSAHLGGILFGFLYYRYADKLKFSGPASDNAGIELPKWFTRRKNKAAAKYTVNRPSAQKTTPEVDRILDKISAHGFNALNDKEKETLQRAHQDLS